MLNPISTHRHAQRGMVLILSIIVLVAMSLAGIALMRSVLTGNRVAGNAAFQQAASMAADVGTERAVAWLEQQARQVDGTGAPANRLWTHKLIGGPETVGYRAIREDPNPAFNETWEAAWQIQVDNPNRINTLPPDAAGNTVSYLIQRLCAGEGDPSGAANCEVSPTQVSSGATSSKGAGLKIKLPPRIYYRITVRVEGPRNAVSFSQSIVSI
jgi:type IV pilus assembly protein PilX